MNTTNNYTDKLKDKDLSPFIPEILERLQDHCDWCADCPYQSNPDTTCRFGQLWKNLSQIP